LAIAMHICCCVSRLGHDLAAVSFMAVDFPNLAASQPHTSYVAARASFGHRNKDGLESKYRYLTISCGSCEPVMLWESNGKLGNRRLRNSLARRYSV